MDLLGYLAMFFVGGALGLIGAGGAILTVPIMVYLFHKTAVAATSYSLFIVGISSLFGVWRYHRQNLVDYKKAILFALPSFLGIYLARRILMPYLPEVIYDGDHLQLSKDQLVMAVFAIVMVGASFSMIGGKKVEFSGGRDGVKESILLLTLGLLVGFVAGFVGAGGGFLIIPALVVLAHMPMPKAVGTSLLIISANSLIGFSGDLLAGNALDWRLLILASAIALVGTFAGSYAARSIPSAKLKPAFGWFVLVMGAYILFKVVP